MAYVCDHPGFTVNVISGFINERQWSVRASVEYRPEGAFRSRRVIEAQARLELMIGISRESQNGRDRGAGEVLVLVEGDQDLAGFFRGV